jgi:hypothetical protein
VHRLFWTIASSLCFAASLASHAISDPDPNTEIVFAGGQLGSRADRIFVGRDESMPLDGRFDMAVNPPLDKKGGLIVPTQIGDSFQVLRNSLPHWFLLALLDSHGDQDCSVKIDHGDHSHLNYLSLVLDWVWASWNLTNTMSPLRLEFHRAGIDNDIQVDAAFTSGFCRFVRTGSVTKALETVSVYGRRGANQRSR